MSVISKLVEVRALPDYKLWLHYSDGVTGEVMLLARGITESDTAR